MSRIFIDSSIIIESLKGNEIAANILKQLYERGFVLMINPIVFSEVVYIFIKYSGKSKLKQLFELLNSFIMLDLSAKIVKISENFILKYGLFPNDAMILATCKFYDINFLASLDKDFEHCCNSENIKLINDPRMI